MGHRIELEEIEHALAAIPEIEGAACFYDREKNKVVACYIGIDDKKYLITAMKKKVSSLPHKALRSCQHFPVRSDDFPHRAGIHVHLEMEFQLDMLPLNKNGKTDKKLLEAQYREGAFA